MSDIPKSADTVYTQRAALAVALARYVLKDGGAAGYHPPSQGEWATLYIDIPGGTQISYHISDADAHLLEGLPLYAGKWNGTFLGRGADWLEAVSMPSAENVARSRLAGTALNRWELERDKLMRDRLVTPEQRESILMGYARRW